MLAHFSIQDLDQKEIFFKLSNAISLSNKFNPGRKVHGIYAIYNEHGVCCYVGQSKNIASRLATHIRGRYSNFSSIKVYTPEFNSFEDYYERNEPSKSAILDYNEKVLMSIEKPVDNILIDLDLIIDKDKTFSSFTEDSFYPCFEIKSDDYVDIKILYINDFYTEHMVADSSEYDYFKQNTKLLFELQNQEGVKNEI